MGFEQKGTEWITTRRFYYGTLREAMNMNGLSWNGMYHNIKIFDGIQWDSLELKHTEQTRAQWDRQGIPGYFWKQQEKTIHVFLRCNNF